MECRQMTECRREKNSRCETFGWNVGGRRIPDARHPDGMSAEKNSRCETSEEG